jgi:hypothetical protein
MKGILDMNEAPDKVFDWNSHCAPKVADDLNISSESLKEDLIMCDEEPLPNMMNKVEEIKGSDAEMNDLSDQSNEHDLQRHSSHGLERKMSVCGGYKFQHNTNQLSMQRGND